MAMLKGLNIGSTNGDRKRAGCSQADESVGDLVGHRMVAEASGARHNGGDPPVKPKLDQNAGRRRHLSVPKTPSIGFSIASESEHIVGCSQLPSFSSACCATASSRDDG
jgi:hypothetical protein